jgi:hypothetical protein
MPFNKALWHSHQLHRSFKIFGSLAGQEPKMVYPYTKTSKQVTQNMFWLMSSQRSNRVRNCSHIILCIFSITVIRWLPQIFWGNSVNVKLIFRLQKRAIRAIMQIPKTASYKQRFKSLHILPLPSLFIYEILVYIKSNLNDFITNSELHSHNTRKKDDLYIVPYKTSLCKYNFISVGLRLLNLLPQYVKEISVQYKFKNASKTLRLQCG